MVGELEEERVNFLEMWRGRRNLGEGIEMVGEIVGRERKNLVDIIFFDFIGEKEFELGVGLLFRSGKGRRG